MLKVKLDDDVLNFLKAKNKLIDKKTIGVYFLTFRNTVVYVGQTTCIKNRISGHISEQEKVFDDFYFMECSKNMLESTELSYIIAYDPIFNKKDSLTKGLSLEEFCFKNNLESWLFVDKKKYCFAQLFEDDRDKLIELKRKMGAASIAVVVKKLIAQFGDKLK